MRHYETIFIINPNLAEDDYKQVLAKYQDLLEKEKGLVVKVDEWGKQRLAYVLKKFDRGSYVLVEYCGEAGVTSAIERELKMDDRILKYQTVKLDDDVDPETLIAPEPEEKAEAAPEKEAAEPSGEAQETPDSSTEGESHGV